MTEASSLTPRFPVFLHGGDYNPDQWLDHPEILEQDIELMHKAHVNCVSIAIFAWARLEPEDGVYDFAWLDEVIDRLWRGGIHIILATPSGARPAWMAQKYPEVLRVNQHYERYHFGGRHNHCLTSPVYRRKVREMDTALAQRYAHHPAVILWHLSNEFSGDCYCPLCQEKFRQWLKKRYGTLENLNQAWWTSFWSHRYTDWSQVEAPGEMAETSTNGMFIDWRQLPAATDALQWAGWIWRGTAVWDKGNSRPQKGRFRQQAEYIVWGSNGDMPISRPVPCLPGVFKYGNPQNRIHLTEKPLQLMRDIVKITGHILDPFAGSGTTVLAAVLEGYSATGIEVTDAYAALARGRIRQALEDVQ